MTKYLLLEQLCIFFFSGIVRGPVGVPGADARQGGVPRTALRPPRGGDHSARRGRPKVTKESTTGLS